MDDTRMYYNEKDCSTILTVNNSKLELMPKGYVNPDHPEKKDHILLTEVEWNVPNIRELEKKGILSYKKIASASSEGQMKMVIDESSKRLRSYFDKKFSGIQAEFNNKVKAIEKSFSTEDLNKAIKEHIAIIQAECLRDLDGLHKTIKEAILETKETATPIKSRRSKAKKLFDE